jgi:hypothetical protein
MSHVLMPGLAENGSHSGYPSVDVRFLTRPVDGSDQREDQRKEGEADNKESMTFSELI